MPILKLLDGTERNVDIIITLTETPTRGGKVKHMRIDLEKSEDWLQVGASMVEYSKDGYIFYVPIRLVSFIGTRALEVDEFARDVQRELR